MTETYVSKHVAEVAVRVVQRDFERVSTSGLGESRTYTVPLERPNKPRQDLLS